MSDPTPDSDDAHPLPGASATLNEVYRRAGGLSFWDFDLDGRPAATALREYLDALKTGLADAANAAGWKVDEPGPELHNHFADDAPPSDFSTPTLFVPLFQPDHRSPSEGPSAVRRIPLGSQWHWHLHSPSSKPYNDAVSFVETAPGRATLSDVPTPLEHGAFDQEFVWVSRDPADTLLLKGVDINAVSLAAPSRTLGSARGLYDLIGLEALTYRTRPNGTLFVIDPGVTLSEEEVGRLKTLFVEVREAHSLEALAGRTLTGLDLARHIASSHRGGMSPDEIRSYLLRWVSHASLPRHASPIPLPPRFAGPAGRRGPQPERAPLAFVRSTELAPTGDGGIHWVAKPLLARGAVTELYGDAKSGKSTLVFSMAVAVAEGKKFLEHQCDKGPVLYLSEQTAGIVEVSMDRAGGRSAEVYILSHEGLASHDFAATAKHVLKECQRLKARLVVFDTVSQVAGIKGDGENSAGVVEELYESFRALSATGAAVLLVRHARKSRGRGPKGASGSYAWGASADHVVEFVKPPGGGRDRVMTLWGRFTDDFTLRVRLGDEGYEVVKNNSKDGKPDEVDRSPSARDLLRSAVTRVLEEGNGMAMCADDVVARWNPSDEPTPDRKRVSKVLKALHDDGKAVIVSGGVRGKPFLFRLCPPSPTGTSDGTK